MDYKEKYEQALERAKSIYNADKITGLEVRTCEQIFPELAESGDEKIRKDILKHLNETMKDGVLVPQQWIAWLEKQGEQKPVEIKPIFETGDVMRTKEEAEKDCKDGMPVVVSIDDEYYHCNNELIAIKNQHDYEYPPINRNQKPVEWSEEDEKMLERVIDSMQFYLVDAISNESKEVERLVKEEIDWLKSLKDKVQPQPKQEWSKEDEAHFKSIISTIEYCKNEYPNATICVEAYNSDLNWLKSLKHCWKPSE